MASAQKKVVIRSFTGELAWGYLPQGGFLQAGEISYIGVDGRLGSLDINNIRTICYVRDFNVDDRVDPERIGRRAFPARPRGDGLWLRMTFRDQEVLEGLADVNLGFADTLLEDRGIFMTPPDARANTQRLFIPRAALRSMEVLGFVTAPSRRILASHGAQAMAETQTKLFGE